MKFWKKYEIKNLTLNTTVRLDDICTGPVPSCSVVLPYKMNPGEVLLPRAAPETRNCLKIHLNLALAVCKTFTVKMLQNWGEMILFIGVVGPQKNIRPVNPHFKQSAFGFYIHVETSKHSRGG